MHRFAILAVLLLSAAPVLAQSPDDRVALTQYRDALDRRIDAAAMRDEVATIHDSLDRHRGNAITEMHAGYLDLRLAAIKQDRPLLLDAEKMFTDAISDHKDWPLAYVGRAYARIALSGDAVAPGAAHVVQSVLTGDPGSAAADDIVMSLRVDSTYVAGLTDLVGLAMQGYRPGQLRAALLATRRVARLPFGRTLEMELARLRLERTDGSIDSAVAISEDLLARYPDNSEVMLEAAHTGLHVGNGRAGDLWFTGLTRADSVTALLYRSDLVSLLPDTVLKKFDAARNGAGRAEVVRSFLELDDPQLLRTGSERLREHYRRLDAARLLYGLPKAAYAVGRIAMSGHVDVDERGVVLVLHGEPDEHTSFNLMSAPPNESWYYKGRDGDDMVFHFIRPDPARGFIRVPSIFDIVSNTTAFKQTGKTDVESDLAKGKAVQTHGASWSAQTAQELLYSRENVSPYYSKILSGSMKDAAALQAAERAAGDSSLRHRETWALTYELPLDASLDVLAVGAEGSTPLLQVAYAIPGGSLYPRHMNDRVVYPIRLRVTVMNGTTLVKRVDTLRTFAMASELNADQNLLGRVSIPVPAGDYTVRLALETEGNRGTVAPPQTVHVSSTAPARIDLSDLALGSRSVPLPMRLARGDTLWVNPLQSFLNNEPMELYFEINGIENGSTYNASMKLFRTDDKTPLFAIAFAGKAASSPAGVHREVDLTRFKPGSYQLEITITQPNGAIAVRTRSFMIRK